MRSSVSFISLISLLLMPAACGAPCPLPSVYPVPPVNVSGHSGRLELPLPLSDQSAEAAGSFLAGCATDGSSQCETPVPSEQLCILKALTSSSFEEAEGCPGARSILVYDARADAPLAGIEAKDWVFANDKANNNVVIFHGYFPQQVY